MSEQMTADLAGAVERFAGDLASREKHVPGCSVVTVGMDDARTLLAAVRELQGEVDGVGVAQYRRVEGALRDAQAANAALRERVGKLEWLVECMGIEATDIAPRLWKEGNTYEDDCIRGNAIECYRKMIKAALAAKEASK